MALLPNLQLYIEEKVLDFNTIDDKRKSLLIETAKQINTAKSEKNQILLTFICTHNSRRSMFGQVWAKASAAYFGISSVETYSGGTEATAFNERAVVALERAGFQIDKEDDTINPIYKVKYSESEGPLLGYSKVYDTKENPQKDFMAIMTCDHADANCPFIPGADRRISLPYRDPKESDGTDKEVEIYDERCLQIAKEMFYLMTCVKEIV